jgi:hypothetical protein
MITRHVHRTVTFGFDEWADDEEIILADSLMVNERDQPDVDDDPDIDIEDDDEQ